MSTSSLSSRVQETKDSKSVHEVIDASDNNQVQEYEGFHATATEDIRDLAKTMSHLSREQTRKSHGSEDLVRVSRKCLKSKVCCHIQMNSMKN